jgi:uncharacterized sporulation protein YeaH/YhbH (DUF444 family)
MGLKDDLKRYRDVGEDRRQDLTEFIQQGELNAGENISIPIKIISLPEFTYNKWDQGGIGQGDDAEQGDPVEMSPDDDADGDETEAGDGEGEHDYYEMDPEEFAEELEDELDLDLDPKGKRVKETIEGDMTDIARAGPKSTLDVERMFKKGLKRKLATTFDSDYLEKVLRVDGIGVTRAWEWAREQRMPVSKGVVQELYDSIARADRTEYDTIEDIPGDPTHHPRIDDIGYIPFRRQDKRHKYPEIIEKKQKNVVVVNIRDISGSMNDSKRELVERVFTPLDWYLQGKYDHAEFVYIIHDSSAWQVEREQFFGVTSGGGTRISSAYELAQDILEEQYPWDEWNRYVFAAGDGENIRRDSLRNVIPLLDDIDANLHAYLEVDAKRSPTGTHGTVLTDHYGDESSNVVVSEVESTDDVIDSISDILSTEDDTQ